MTAPIGSNLENAEKYFTAENAENYFHRGERGERGVFCGYSSRDYDLARQGVLNPRKNGRAIGVMCGREALRVLRVLRGESSSLRSLLFSYRVTRTLNVLLGR